MRIFLSSLLIVGHLLCLPLPGAALGSHGTDVGVQGNDGLAGRSSGRALLYVQMRTVY